MKEGVEFRSGECSATLNGTQLVVANQYVRRAWTVRQGRLFATSFFDVEQNVEWMAEPAGAPAPTSRLSPETSRQTFRGAAGTFGPTQGRSLRLELEEAGSEGSVAYEFQVFPDAAGIRMWIVDKTKQASPAPKSLAAPPTRLPQEDALEHLPIATPHLRVTQVTLRDRSDDHNELVFEDEWLLHPNESPVKLKGNVFFAENILTGDGLVFLKEAPQPEMRPVRSEFDAWFSGTGMAAPSNHAHKRAAHFDLSFYGNGLSGPGTGYPYSLMAYHGGRSGRIAALHAYQRALRPYDPVRDGGIASNTWGDRSLGNKLNADFVRAEIDAGRRLGVDTVQIDDGWESGKTQNVGPAGGVWNDYWRADRNFWKPDPEKFPRGLAPLADYAHSRGLKLGLWFAPDSHDDFVNWRKDAEQLLKWNREEHVDSFKLDSVKILTKDGETNYRALIDTFLSATAGKALLDLDVTAETRQGYFGNIEAGPLYVENRYTDTHRYWPHQTLRNLWKLSQYVDPVRLRMEFLNSSRNQALYPGDPLAPARYKPDCLFAITMMSSPLAFFESSALPPEYVRDAAPLIATWKKEREPMQKGTILPIGDTPDGMTWTGFASLSADKHAGYLLLFRELNADSHWTTPPGLFAEGAYTVSALGGDGTVTQQGGRFDVEIPQPLGFVWVKISAAAAAN